jgi:hypothetical protein
MSTCMMYLSCVLWLKPHPVDAMSTTMSCSMCGGWVRTPAWRAHGLHDSFVLQSVLHCVYVADTDEVLRKYKNVSHFVI